MPGTEKSIMQATFPTTHSDDVEIESQMNLITGIITGIRNVRGEMNIAPSVNLDVIVQSQDDAKKETIERHQDIIINLARLKTLLVSNLGERPKASATSIVDGASIFVSLEGIIDFSKETDRLEKEIDKLSKELSKVAKKLQNEDFLNKAPADVVTKVREKQGFFFEKLQKLQSNLDRLSALEI
jgi:valyl-tRNA synthetase